MRRLASGDEGAMRPCTIIPRLSLIAGRHYFHVFLHVFDDAVSNDTAEIHGHGVADEAPEYLELDGLALWHEGIVAWKPLENRAFTK